MTTINIDLSNLPKATNDCYTPLYKNKDRYLVLYGGAGSGKSIYAAQKIIYRMVTQGGHKFLVVRKVGKTLKNSVYALFKDIIRQWGMNQLFRYNETNMEIICANGNRIICVGLDDPEKLKSIHGITGIWIEEASELTQEDFQQLDLRLRGKTDWYKQIMLTFNPISITHWLKTIFFDRKKENSTVVHTTYKNNKFIDNEYKRTLEAMKDQDEYYYTVYALGEWGVLGKTVFNAKKVTERIVQLREKEPLKIGRFEFDYEGRKIVKETIKWVDDPNGHIRLYELPDKQIPYVLGGDTAGEGSDYFSGHVIDNTTGCQVAVLHHQFDEHMYARQMYCLGFYYGWALAGMEVNFSTFPTREFEEWEYPRMYTRTVEDSYTHKPEKRYGFMTGKITRPLIIANLVKIVDESVHLINDLQTLEEMLTFVRNENGRPEAQEGKFDDLVMGLAITYHIRDQQDFKPREDVSPAAPKLADKLGVKKRKVV